MTRPHRLIVVGTGMAAARLVELLVARRGAHVIDITMFGDEPGGTYNRILLSGVLAGRHAGPDIVTHPVEWFSDHRVAVHAGVRIVRLDLSARHVVDARGESHPFDTLVLATGSRPVLPPIAGLVGDDGRLLTGCFVFRTVDDCARIAAAAASAHRVAVIGGGLLGLEAARGLSSDGLPVTVVHRGSHLMDSQLDEHAGHTLRRQFEACGVRILTGATTVRLLGDERVAGLEFSDGSRLACDLVVIAAGVRPNAELAVASGLHVGHGITVGDDLACPGVDGVYALGDCAEHEGKVYGLVAPAWEQADVLADILTGRRPEAAYRGSQVATKLKVAGLDVAVMGLRDAHIDDDVITYAEPSRGIYSKVIIRHERIAGAMVIGAAAAVPSLVQRFLDASRVPTRRSDLLFPPAGDAPSGAVDQIPNTARICDCNAVAKEDIVDAVLNGARSLSAVCEATRAGTGCGSCRPEVQRILDFVCRAIAGGPAPIDGEHHASA